MFIPIVTNPCGYPHCWEFQCELCSHFKPRLFGFIPVSRKFGERLMMWEERLFMKKYVKYTDEPIDDLDGDFE
jgi:hypothetical protein